MPPPVRSAEREGRPNHCGRRRRARMPIPSAEDSADAVRIFYCIRVETAHNVRSDGSCARREKKKGRGVSPYSYVLGTLARKLSCALVALLAICKQDITRTDNIYTVQTTSVEAPKFTNRYKELFTLYKLGPSAMPSRDNSSIVASFLLFSVRSRTACAAPLQLNRVKES